MNEKKKRVLDVAMDLFLEKGFTQTSIQDIIKKAEISKGTFYNYFTSKNECLIAILTYVDSEADQKRREIAQGEDIRDEEVFSKQIAVRMYLNKEHNLFALFESVMFSKDPELLAFIRRQHVLEMQWIAKRITDIYTPQTDKYALDQAAMLLGMIHHLMHVWTLGTNKDISTEKLIQFAIQRLKPIIADQIEKQEAFFPANWLTDSLEEKPLEDIKEQLLAQLEKACEAVSNADQDQTEVIEYLSFLTEEIEKENPRTFVLESVMLALSKKVENGIFQFEIRKLSKIMWEFITTSK